MKNRTGLAALAMAAIAGLITGCSSGDSESGTIPFGSPSPVAAVAQPQPPSLVVTAPTGNDSFTAKSATLTLTGYASKEVTDLSWTSSQGASGKPAGLESWTITDIPLQNGENTITITGKSASGETVNVVRKVTRNANIDLLSPLIPSPDYLFVNEAAPIAFSIQLENSVALDKSSVKLVQVDAQGTLIGTIGPLADTNNDFLFKGQFSLTAPTAGKQYYRVTGTVGGQPFMSEPEEIFVTTHISEADLTTLAQVSDQANSLYADATRQGKSAKAAQQAVIDFLRSNSVVESATTTDAEGLGITIFLKNGLRTALNFSPAGTRSGSPDPSAVKPDSVAPLSRVSSLVASVVRKLENDGTVVPDYQEAVSLSPYNAEFEIDESQDVAKLLNEAVLTPYRTDFLKNGEVDLDQMRHLDGYGVVHITTHADTVSRDGTRGSNQSGADVVLHIAKYYRASQLTNGLNEALQVDIQARRITPVWTANNQSFHPLLHPSFISHEYRYRRLHDSLVTASACRSTWNNSMAYAFLGVGAKAYTGYSNYVTSAFAAPSTKTLYDRLIKQRLADGSPMTAGDAFIPGQFEIGVEPIAGQRVDFRMIGDPKLVLQRKPHLKFQPQPPSSTPPRTTFSVGVTVLDGAGQVVNTTNPITIVLATNPNNATLSGTTTLNAVNGGVTFNLSLDKPGKGYKLLATTDKIGASVVVNATSSEFDVEQSPDWTSRPFGGNLDFFEGVAYGNGTYVAVGGTGLRTGIIAASTDAAHWFLQSFASVNNTDLLQKVRYINGRFVALGRAENLTGAVYTSSDGVNWVGQGVPGYLLNEIAYLNGVYVATGLDSTLDSVVVTSTDLSSWTVRLRPGAAIVSLAKGATNLVGVGLGGEIISSPDGITWTTRIASSPTSGAFQGVTYGNGVFVAAGGSILTSSDDGISWIDRPFDDQGTPLFFRDVAFGRGQFKAVGEPIPDPSVSTITTQIYSSNDGISWTRDRPGRDDYLYGVTFGPQGFAAVGFHAFVSAATILTNP